MKGTIKVIKDWFGFITSDEAKNDIFFHAWSITNKEFRDLREGDILEFEIWEGNNGKKQAINISCK